MALKKNPKNMKANGAGKKAGAQTSSRSSGWMVMLFFASGFMFFIGVLVGRNTAPIHFDKDNLEQKLAHLQRSVLDKSSGATAAIEKKLQKNMVFDFYDKLKEKTDHHGGRVQTPVKKPRYPKPGPMALAMAGKAPENAGPDAGVESGPEIAAEAVETKTPPQAALHPAETDISAKQTKSVEHAPVVGVSAAKPPEQKQERVAEASNAPAPEKKPAPSGRRYAIQVASLKDTKSAESIKNKFRLKGYPAYVQEALVEGRGQWFRVRIGPYADMSQAESDLSRLQQAGVDAIIFLSNTGANSNAEDKNENNKG